MPKKDNVDQSTKNKQAKSSSNANTHLGKIAQKIISLVDPNYEYDTDLDAKNMKFQNIINREMNLANGVSHGSIIDFIQAQRESERKNNKHSNQIGFGNVGNKDIFSENIDQVYNYLLELYDNKYSEMLDLKYICKFIPALGQALKTTLDHVTAADSVADTIKRKIIFESNVSQEIQATIMNKVEELEKEHKLLKKLKNITFKYALTCGLSYIYSIPYVDLFQEFQKHKKQSPKNNGGNGPFNSIAKESYEGINPEPKLSCYGECIEIATESVNNIISSISNDTFKTYATNKNEFIKNTEAEIVDIVNSFSFIEGDLLQCAMEEASTYVAMESNGSFKSKKNTNETKKKPSISNNKYNINIPDGTKDPEELKRDSLINLGNYIKFIESRDLVPFKIFNEVVGYYHIVSKKKKKTTRTTLGTTSGLFTSSLEIANQRKEQAVDSIVDAISDMIVKNFDHKFLIDNQDFKKTIGDCIIAKGIVDNEYSIQFIPAKYIHAFKIGEDINGDGESMLAESLFPGKMLLSYLVAKMLLFVNNAGDKTLITTHRGPIDTNGKNQMDRTIRMMEGSNINFGDFLSPNVMFNKFNRNANILIPTALNGDKLLEFEKLEGKDMNMHTDMEEKLEKMILVGSSVPDSIMEYINDIQFSRQVVSSSIKYAGVVSSIQMDLEEPTTEFYQDLLMHTNLPEECKNVIPHIKFLLPRPKVVSNLNNSENIRVGKEIAELISELYYGVESKTTDADAKREMTLAVCKKLITFFEWDEMDEIRKTTDERHHGPKKQDENASEY